MALSSRRLGLRAKILLLSPLLFIGPWYHFNRLVEMNDFLYQGQLEIQLRKAEHLAIKLSDRDDLFKTRVPLSVEFKHFPTQALSSKIHIDGKIEDWLGQINNTDIFTGGVTTNSFYSVVGKSKNFLNILIRVKNNNVTFWSDLEQSNRTEEIHVRFLDQGKKERAIILLPTQSGIVNSFHPDKRPLPASWSNFAGIARPAEAGYIVEARLPLSIFEDDNPNIEIGVLSSTASSDSLYAIDKESFYMPTLESRDLIKFISENNKITENYFIFDDRMRIRAKSYLAATENEKPYPEKKFSYFYNSLVEKIDYYFQEIIERSSNFGKKIDYGRAIREVLNSTTSNNPVKLFIIFPDGFSTLIAAYPITRAADTFGTVVLLQDTREIASVSSNTSARLILASALTLLVTFVFVLLATTFIAGRLRKLERETRESVDQYSRLKDVNIHQIRSGDEISELSNTVSNVLSRLHQHNQFLEHMPRTLRHEINNPLNVVSTSLQNLAEEIPSTASSKYMDSAKRGVNHIGSIVQYLADAVNLEESLKSEDKEVVNISLLLENYVANCHLIHKDVSFDYRGPQHPLYARVSDYRIEQLLDKIIGNAVDFQKKGTRIQVHLSTLKEYLQIIVSNYGPTLPAGLEGGLFDSMVTDRISHGGSSLHFGLGLYIVKVISEHHGGFATASNLVDLSGVQIMVSLPRVASYSVTVKDK